MKKFVVVIMFFLSFIAKAQFFSVFDLDKSNYPMIKAKYVAIDAKGRQIFNLQKQEVAITENDKSGEVVNLTNPIPAPPQPLSVVLTIDVSGSMKSNNIEIAKAAAITFINLLSFDVSECAISSFDNENYFNCDFTKNPDRLKIAINALHAQNGTDYDVAFTGRVAGAFRVAENGKNRKIVIFLTDGIGMGNQDEIIHHAKQQNITVFCITVGLPMPEILKQVANQTGGLWFEKVDNIKQAIGIYSGILQTAQMVNAGEIEWKAHPTCNPSIQFSITSRSMEYKGLYYVPETEIVRLGVQPSFIKFRNTMLGKPEKFKVTLTAQNAPVTINSVYNNNESLFTLTGENFPLSLAANESRSLILAYTPVNNSPSFCRIGFENNICNTTNLYATGGFSNNRKKISSEQSGIFKVTSPNGDEIFSAGTDTIISWTGCNVYEKVKIYYSENNGIDWNKIADNVSGLKYRWTTPRKTGSNYRIKISQGISIKDTENDSINEVVFFNVTSAVNNAVFSPDGSRIMTLSDDNLVRLWDINGNLISSIQANKLIDRQEYSNDLLRPVFSPNGEKVLTAGMYNRTVKLWNLNGDLLHVFSNLTAHFYDNSFVFSPDGSCIIAPDSINSITIWNCRGRLLHTLFGHSGLIRSIAFSPDGLKILTASEDHTAKLWDINGKLLQTFKGHSNKVLNASFSPDGFSILTASLDSTAKLWDMNGNLLHTMMGHNGEVFNAIFSPNSSQILTACSDSTAKLWDIDGNLIQTIKGHSGAVRIAIFSPDGSQILTAGDDHAAKLWNIGNSDGDFQEVISDRCFTLIAPKPIIHDIVFGKQTIGIPIEKLENEFLINNNNLASVILKIEIRGSDSSDFSLVSGIPPFIIPSWKSKDVEFRFTPSAIGERIAQAFIITPQDTIICNLKGTGIIQQFEISNKFIDFGKLKVGSGCDTSVVVIKNSGTEPLKISNIINDGPDSVQFSIANTKDLVLDAGNMHTLNFTFKPLQRGRTNTIVSFVVDNFPGLQQIVLFGESEAIHEISLQGTVLDVKLKKPIVANVRCYDLYYNSLLKEIKTLPDGKFSFTLPVDRRYSITAECDSFITASESIDLTGIVQIEKLNRDILLSKIETGVTVRLNNIFFEFNKTELSDVSSAELNRVYDLLIQNQGMQIEIDGHSDNVGSEAYNLQLSQDRANSVYNFIVEKGINAIRLKAIGCGMNKPVDTNNTEEGRRQNRRVEFTILKK